MSHPKRSSAYPDCREAFDLALSHGSALQPFRGTPEEIRRAAVRWRQRAYTFRARLAAESGGETQYDSIVCTITPEGVQIVDQAAGAILPPVPTGEAVRDIPLEIPDFAAIAKEFGLD